METNRTAPILVGFVLAAFVFTVLGLASQDARIRSGDGLCEEVDYELGESVRSGLVEPEEALEASQRCYDRFGANSYD